MTTRELTKVDRRHAVAGKSEPGSQNLRYTEETRPLTVTWDGGGVVRLEGELDIATVAEVEAGLNCHLTRPGRLVFDLSELTFMGSEGIHLFNRIAKKRQSIGPLVLMNPRPIVRRVMQISCMHQMPNMEVR